MWRKDGLVDRKKLLEAVNAMPTWDGPSHPEYVECEKVVDLIASQPTLRSTESQRVKVPFGNRGQYHLDECGKCHALLTDVWKYCPNCGENVRKE